MNLRHSTWALAIFFITASSLATTVPIPSTPRVTKTPTRLNNFVVEILKVHGKEAKEIRSIKHFQPVDGWVYVAAEAKGNAAERILLSWDNDTDARRALRAPGEKQTWLEAGEHVLTVDRAGAADLESLIIRRVLETSFSKFGATPRVLATGDYDWDWLSQHVLPHLNTIVGYNSASQLPFIQQWKSRGGRWMAEVPRPASPAGLLREFGVTNPFVDGVNIDEFGPGLRSLPGWARDLPDLSEKEFRPYMIAERPDEMREFIRAVQRGGGKFIWERYLGEIPPEMDERARLQRDLGDWAGDLTNRFPGILRQSVICLGIFSAPPLSLNRSPQIDFKVWLDLQFQYVATHPAFQALPGLMVYQSRNSDQETLRWAAALFRHYAIEGQTNLLSARHGFTYRLDHFDMPPQQIISNLSLWQGIYPPHETLDRGMIFDRAGQKWTQQLRNIVPGRLYTAKFISALLRDLETARSEPALHPVRLTVSARNLPEGSFQQALPCSGRGREPFSDENPLWLNYHQVTFRGESNAIIEVSGLGGDRVVVSFVEVQPFFSQ